MLLNPVQVTLGMLVDSVPRDAVDDAITACGVRERRSDGKLPAHVITYLTLGLALFPDDDYQEVATKVLTVVESAVDGFFGVADVRGVRMPRPAGPGGALVGGLTSWSAR